MNFQETPHLLNSPLSEGLLGAVIGAVVGAAITAFATLRQTRIMLNAETRQRKEDLDRELQSIAAALLCEIDNFRNVVILFNYHLVKDADPEQVTEWDRNPANHLKRQPFTGFRVFEATAEKVGLFEPGLIQAVIDYQGDARDCLNTLNEYARVSEQYRLRQADEKLLKHMFTLVKKTALEMVPKTNKVCELLKTRMSARERHA